MMDHEIENNFRVYEKKNRIRFALAICLTISIYVHRQQLLYNIKTH